jgi:hypothetical protein
MAAFFTINIDAFHSNDDNKLPLGYVLKYIRKALLNKNCTIPRANATVVSISGAVSIPFILLIFNDERIADWIKKIGNIIADKMPTMPRLRRERRPKEWQDNVDL